MNRRTWLAAALLPPALSGCYGWGKFDLAWQEEVLLPDGRVIVVSMKHTYLRLERSFTEYGGLSTPLDTTMSFDAGPGIGVVTQLFMGFSVLFLGQKDGVWYGILGGRYYPGARETSGQEWGDYEGYHSQLAIKLEEGHWRPMHLRDFPREFTKPNIMTAGDHVKETSTMNGRHISLEEKNIWSLKNPRGVTNVNIDRPRTNTVNKTR